MFCSILVVFLLTCAGEGLTQMMWPVYHLPYLHPVTATQYHAQDTLGQFNFGYANTNQIRTESRLLDGSVRGSYSYLDPNNKVVRVVYIADDEGFRVLEGNNLPTVPAEPAVVEAPRPVEYTPEVAAARAQFEKVFNEVAAQAAQGESAEPAEDTKPTESQRRKKRSVLLPALVAIAPASLKVKVTEGQEVKDVVSPASTKPVDYKEVERSVAVPPLVFARSSAPFYHYLYAV